MVKLEVYATNGVIVRLWKAQEIVGGGSTLAGLSIDGHFFRLVPDKKHKIPVKLVIEQSGAGLRRGNLFVEESTLDLLENGGDKALIALCGEPVKQEPAIGLKKCGICIDKI